MYTSGCVKLFLGFTSFTTQTYIPCPVFAVSASPHAVVVVMIMVVLVVV